MDTKHTLKYSIPSSPTPTNRITAIPDYVLNFLFIYLFTFALCPLQTLQVMYPYLPQNEDELELVPGDFIFMSPVEQGSASEGWVYGTSLSTGLSGLLPENYVDRADECDTWVFHG